MHVQVVYTFRGLPGGHGHLWNRAQWQMRIRGALPWLHLQAHCSTQGHGCPVLFIKLMFNQTWHPFLKQGSHTSNFCPMAYSTCSVLHKWLLTRMAPACASAVSKSLRDTQCHLRRGGKVLHYPTLPVPPTGFRCTGLVSARPACTAQTELTTTHHSQAWALPWSRTLQWEPVVFLLHGPCPTGQMTAPRHSYSGSKSNLAPAHSTKLVFQNTKLVFSNWAWKYLYFPGAKLVMIT